MEDNPRELLIEAKELLHHTRCIDNDAMKCPACSLESRIDTFLMAKPPKRVDTFRRYMGPSANGMSDKELMRLAGWETFNRACDHNLKEMRAGTSLDGRRNHGT